MPTFVGDFLVTVSTWPPDRVGAYWLALCYQWEHGGVPASDERELAGVLHASRPVARRLWTEIQQKYRQHADGLWWNPRLEEVRIQARKQNALSSERGKKGAAARWGKGAMTRMQIDAPSNAQALPEQSPSNSNHTHNQNQNQDPLKRDPVSAHPQSARAPLTRGPLSWGNSHSDHEPGFCDWFCFPGDQARQFANQLLEPHPQLGFDAAHAQVIAWAKQVRTSGIIPTGKWYAFWSEQWELKHGKATSKAAQTRAAGKSWAERKAREGQS